MADPHNHTHQQRRHTRLGILAALTLTAALLAVAATPATAQDAIDERFDPSVRPAKTACLGPATQDAGFTDVGMGTHYNNIQCLAHYNITTGTTATTYNPRGNVTRSQMALFLHRMATVAGVELEDTMDAGYTDLNGIADTRVNAINRLANAGIMTGRSETRFDPLAHVTRAEMAVFLANFMAVSTSDSSDSNIKINNDGTYTIETNDGEDLDDSNFDYFKDARRTQPIHVDSAISAIFELGITTGYSDGTFKPNNHVSRAEMATFILRTLAHTNTRPMGLTAQSYEQDGEAYLQVSLRDTDFQPVDNAPLDLFRSYYPDDAFADDATCVQRFVLTVTPSDAACEIDDGDTITEEDGNKEYTEDDLKDTGEDIAIECGTEKFSIIDDDENPAVFWVWTGDLEDTVGSGTRLVQVEDLKQVNRPSKGKPHHAEVTGGLAIGAQEAKMGRTVTYTLQLHTEHGDDTATAAPDSSGNKYNLVITKSYLKFIADDADTASVDESIDLDGNMTRAQDDGTTAIDYRGTGVPAAPEVEANELSVTPSVVTPDSDGMVTITLSHRDPNRSRDNRDVQVHFTLTPYGDDRRDDNYNTARGGDGGPFPENLDDDDDMDGTADDGDGDSAVFTSTPVIFSDDKSSPGRFTITASGPVFRLERGPNRSASSQVTVSVVDQYGDPVHGFDVSAVSDQSDGNDDATGTSTLPFVEYHTTKRDGTYTINYSYRGDPGTETLTAFGAIENERIDGPDDGDTVGDSVTDPYRLPKRDTDSNSRGLELPQPGDSNTIWGLLLPFRGQDSGGSNVNNQGAKPTHKVYWAGIGREVNNPPSQTTDGTPATGTAWNYLAHDVGGKAFVVDQEDDVVTTARAEPVGPHVYYWDEHDTFEITGRAVSMELFEMVLSSDKVTVELPPVSWRVWLGRVG